MVGKYALTLSCRWQWRSTKLKRTVNQHALTLSRSWCLHHHLASVYGFISIFVSHKPNLAGWKTNILALYLTVTFTSLLLLLLLYVTNVYACISIPISWQVVRPVCSLLTFQEMMTPPQLGHMTNSNSLTSLLMNPITTKEWILTNMRYR